MSTSAEKKTVFCFLRLRGKINATIPFVDSPGHSAKLRDVFGQISRLIGKNNFSKRRDVKELDETIKGQETQLLPHHRKRDPVTDGHAVHCSNTLVVGGPHPVQLLRRGPTETANTISDL